jgi:predicted dithiol-disulfide oxidoreductase (DUF899 family)
MPSIERLASRVADADVAFACVTREPMEKVRAFIEKRGWKLPVYRIEGEPPALFETRSIPATFIIAGDGTVAMRHIGAARWDTDEIVAFLRETAARARAPVVAPESLPS